MSYARNLLARGEEVVFESRQHWFGVLARTWAWVVLAVLALAALIWSATQLTATVAQILQIASLVALLASFIRVALVVWEWRNQEYLITTRRVIKAEGIFSKRMGDSSLEKVNDALLNQSLMGRIFGYGDLEILTASEESAGIDDFHLLADPIQFKIAMLNQKELLERPDLAPPRAQRPAPMGQLQRPDALPPRAGSGRVAEVPAEAAPVRSAPEPVAPGAAAAPSPPPASRADELTATIERLAALRDRGLITADEYEAKKRDLLERM